MRVAVLTFFVFLTSPSFAEYRAFELIITDSASGVERVVLSNLDPIQFRGYYPVKLSETVTYRKTWRCRGNTSGFKSVCPPPESQPKP